MSDITHILAIALHLHATHGKVDADALRCMCEQDGISLTAEQATVAAEEVNRAAPPIVGTIGGVSRVCPCGAHRVWLPQVKLWTCPKCQRSISQEPSEN